MASEQAVTGNVLITGASTGIGRACALRLDGRGFRVFAGVRRPQDGEALRKEASDRLTPVQLDVTDAAAVAEARDAVAAAVGDAGLQGLVNNAGIVVTGPLEALSLDELRRQFDVNLFGVVVTTQAFLDLIRAGRGRIVNMSSIMGCLSTPFTGPYCMSKFALEAYTDALRMELAPWRIPVAAVEPGSIATPIWDKGRQAGEAHVGRWDERTRALYEPRMRAMAEASARMARKGIPPERVADAVVHALTAARPRTRYVVGADCRFLRLLARWVPDRLRDRLILRGLGLDRAGTPPPAP